MYTLLDTCLDRLDIFEFLSHVEDGLKDHYDIKVSTITCKNNSILRKQTDPSLFEPRSSKESCWAFFFWPRRDDWAATWAISDTGSPLNEQTEDKKLKVLFPVLCYLDADVPDVSETVVFVSKCYTTAWVFTLRIFVNRCFRHRDFDHRSPVCQ